MLSNKKLLAAVYVTNQSRALLRSKVYARQALEIAKIPASRNAELSCQRRVEQLTLTHLNDITTNAAAHFPA
ncbi:MAG: hypothetical protein ACI87C_000803 [Paraperlucidibaca sp.]|jgi:hypothetical protein